MRHILRYLSMSSLFALAVFASTISLTGLAKAETVAFNAWGGSPNINAYIEWVGQELKSRHGITLEHVKLNDTASAVSRILAEKTANRTTDGSVDLIWVNGENFASMKSNGLLRDDAWAFNLSNFRFTDPEALPALINDFAIPTDGLESPWGRAQLVFGYDNTRISSPPRSADALKSWIMANPGRFTFPLPPAFVGTTFLKQVLLEVTPDQSVLMQPAEPEKVDAVLAPLWAWLEEVTPSLWRSGGHYPANSTEMMQLLGDREIDIAMIFNPAGFSNNISSGVLPDTIRSYIHEKGTIANVHYVAIPFNASSPQAAMTVANFLLSPEAQIRKANSEIWGDPTVLSFAKIDAADRDAFEALPRGIATLSEGDLSPSLPEPHPSWIPLIEKGWLERFGS